MKYLDQTWKDWIGNMAIKIIENKIALEDYIMTPKGAREAVEWLAIFFLFFCLDALWATWNLWRMLLFVIW
ncbi:hypothetical protein HF563_00710 [Acidithiobacillus ferridurans]|nr:hypothetical protein [Acidithiobacillus ferridurans]